MTEHKLTSAAAAVGALTTEEKADIASRGRKVIDTKLTQDAIDKKAASGKYTTEDCVLMVLNDNPYMRGAVQDWPEIAKVCLNAIRDLQHVLSYKDCYNLLATTVKLYDTQIVSVHRAISDRKRLAYFLSEVLERMLAEPTYVSHICKECFNGQVGVDPSILKGAILKRIATEDVMAVCGRYFRSEILRAEQFANRLQEERLQASTLPLVMAQSASVSATAA